MRYAAIILVSILVVAAAAPASDSPDSTAVKFDLDGKTFMAIITLDESGEPNPKGTILMPYYFAFSQKDDKLWGCIVSIEMNEGDSSPPATQIRLFSSPLVDGIAKGNKFTIYITDTHEGQGIRFPINGRVKKNGVIKLRSTIGDDVIKTVLYPVEIEGESVGGFYQGIEKMPDAAMPPFKSDFITGVVINGNKITIGMFWNTVNDFAYTTGKGIYYDSGEYEIVAPAPTGDIQVSGEIGEGAMTYVFDMPGESIDGTMYYFNNKKRKKPKIKRFIPAAVNFGNVVAVTMKAAKIVPGTIITLLADSDAGAAGTSGVFIREYRMKGKSFDILLNVPSSFSGNIPFKLINPDGMESAVSILLVK